MVLPVWGFVACCVFVFAMRCSLVAYVCCLQLLGVERWLLCVVCDRCWRCVFSGVCGLAMCVVLVMVFGVCWVLLFVVWSASLFVVCCVLLVVRYHVWLLYDVACCLLHHKV